MRIRFLHLMGSRKIAPKIAAAGMVLFAATLSSRAQEPTPLSFSAPCANNSSSRESSSGCLPLDLPTLDRNASSYQLNQKGIAAALGTNTNQGVDLARKLFQQAANKGYAPAEANLGTMYVNGWGCQRNYGTALYWLQLAAKSSNASALRTLGVLYLNGWGVRQDNREAFRYFQKAADGGDTLAMSNLGYFYDQGMVVRQDRVAASNWYGMAADRGDPLGQNNLADMYLRGEGVPEDDALAFALFQKAAEQGNTAARIKLGFLYLNGRGTQKDLEAAYAWINAALLAGDRRGQEYLDYLKPLLSAEQLRRASLRSSKLAANARSSSMVTRPAVPR